MNAESEPPTEQKRCSRCGITSPESAFPWKHRARGLRRSWCRSCARAYGHEHYLAHIDRYKAKAKLHRRSGRLRVRTLLKDYLKSHPCVDCGQADVAVLEFDHREPQSKRMSVSRLAAGAGWSTVLREIDKCDVRCVNCHRRRTSRQFDWAKLKPKPLPAPSKQTAVGRVAPSDPSFLRECSSCYRLQPLSAFAYRSVSERTLNGHCRSCHAAYRRQHYLTNRADYFRRAIAQTVRKRDEARHRLWDYLSRHPCIDCGETSIATLDLDHVDPTSKVTEVAQMVGRRNWNAIQDEIAKCVVRCANCHRRRTIIQRIDARLHRSPVQSGLVRE